MKYTVMVYKIASQAKVAITITDDPYRLGEDMKQEAKELALEAASSAYFEKSEKEFIAEIEKC